MKAWLGGQVGRLDEQVSKQGCSYVWMGISRWVEQVQSNNLLLDYPPFSLLKNAKQDVGMSWGLIR